MGVVHGTAETRALLERMRAGDPDAQCVVLCVHVVHVLMNRSGLRAFLSLPLVCVRHRFDFVEVMACRGGCIGGKGCIAHRRKIIRDGASSHHPTKPFCAGGGQPKSDDPFILQKRIAQVYSLDERSVVRKSHENPAITQVYAQELGKPLGHKSHELLHTSYRDRSAETK